LGYLIGVTLDGEGVVLGYLLALVIGSSLVVLGYHYTHRIPLAELLPNESKNLLLVCCFGLFVGWITFNLICLEDILAKAGLSLALTTIIIGPACWMHPMRAMLTNKIIDTIKK
jgi:hypothetical protein